MSKENFYRTQIWYPMLAGRTFLTSFVKLRPDAVAALAEGIESGSAGSPVAETINDMREPMSAIAGASFAFVDSCAPTDTDRFFARHGAVHSPESAWRNLAQSAKVRAAARNGEIEYVCLRPFRRMNQAREFRLFINNGKLMAMSQYYLVRHFRRLEGMKDVYWDEARNFVKEIMWLLPEKTLTIDVYFTGDGRIVIIDLNPWGPPTDPLLLRSWDADWSEPRGIVLMEPVAPEPVNASF